MMAAPWLLGLVHEFLLVYVALQMDKDCGCGREAFIHGHAFLTSGDAHAGSECVGVEFAQWLLVGLCAIPLGASASNGH